MFEKLKQLCAAILRAEGAEAKEAARLELQKYIQQIISENKVSELKEVLVAFEKQEATDVLKEVTSTYLNLIQENTADNKPILRIIILEDEAEFLEAIKTELFKRIDNSKYKLEILSCNEVFDLAVAMGLNVSDKFHADKFQPSLQSLIEESKKYSGANFNFQDLKNDKKFIELIKRKDEEDGLVRLKLLTSPVNPRVEFGNYGDMPISVILADSVLAEFSTDGLVVHYGGEELIEEMDQSNIKIPFITISRNGQIFDTFPPKNVLGYVYKGENSSWATEAVDQVIKNIENGVISPVSKDSKMPSYYGINKHSGETTDVIRNEIENPAVIKDDRNFGHAGRILELAQKDGNNISPEKIEAQLVAKAPNVKLSGYYIFAQDYDSNFNKGLPEIFSEAKNNPGEYFNSTSLKNKDLTLAGVQLPEQLVNLTKIDLSGIQLVDNYNNKIISCSVVNLNELLNKKLGNNITPELEQYLIRQIIIEAASLNVDFEIQKHSLNIEENKQTIAVCADIKSLREENGSFRIVDNLNAKYKFLAYFIAKGLISDADLQEASINQDLGTLSTMVEEFKRKIQDGSLKAFDFEYLKQVNDGLMIKETSLVVGIANKNEVGAVQKGVTEAKFREPSQNTALDPAALESIRKSISSNIKEHKYTEAFAALDSYFLNANLDEKQKYKLLFLEVFRPIFSADNLDGSSIEGPEEIKALKELMVRFGDHNIELTEDDRRTNPNVGDEPGNKPLKEFINNFYAYVYWESIQSSNYKTANFILDCDADVSSSLPYAIFLSPNFLSVTLDAPYIDRNEQRNLLNKIAKSSFLTEKTVADSLSVKLKTIFEALTEDQVINLEELYSFKLIYEDPRFVDKLTPEDKTVIDKYLGQILIKSIQPGITTEASKDSDINLKTLLFLQDSMLKEIERIVRSDTALPADNFSPESAMGREYLLTPEGILFVMCVLNNNPENSVKNFEVSPDRKAELSDFYEKAIKPELSKNPDFVLKCVQRLIGVDGTNTSFARNFSQNSEKANIIYKNVVPKLQAEYKPSESELGNTGNTLGSTGHGNVFRHPGDPFERGGVENETTPKSKFLRVVILEDESKNVEALKNELTERFKNTDYRVEILSVNNSVDLAMAMGLGITNKGEDDNADKSLEALIEAIKEYYHTDNYDFTKPDYLKDEGFQSFIKNRDRETGLKSRYLADPGIGIYPIINTGEYPEIPISLIFSDFELSYTNANGIQIAFSKGDRFVTQLDKAGIKIPVIGISQARRGSLYDPGETIPQNYIGSVLKVDNWQKDAVTKLIEGLETGKIKSVVDANSTIAGYGIVNHTASESDVPVQANNTGRFSATQGHASNILTSLEERGGSNHYVDKLRFQLENPTPLLILDDYYISPDDFDKNFNSGTSRKIKNFQTIGAENYTSKEWADDHKWISFANNQDPKSNLFGAYNENTNLISVSAVNLSALFAYKNRKVGSITGSQLELEALGIRCSHIMDHNNNLIVTCHKNLAFDDGNGGFTIMQDRNMESRFFAYFVAKDLITLAQLKDAGIYLGNRVAQIDTALTEFKEKGITAKNYNTTLPEEEITDAKEPSIAVGTANKDKVSAVQKGFEAKPENVEGYNVESGITEQPFGREETIKGATNRAKNAQEEYKKKHGVLPDYAVGIESGLVPEEVNGKTTYVDRAFVVIIDKEGKQYISVSEGVEFAADSVLRTSGLSSYEELNKQTTGFGVRAADDMAASGYITAGNEQDPHKELTGIQRLSFLEKAAADAANLAVSSTPNTVETAIVPQKIYEFKQPSEISINLKKLTSLLINLNKENISKGDETFYTDKEAEKKLPNEVKNDPTKLLEARKKISATKHEEFLSIVTRNPDYIPQAELTRFVEEFKKATEGSDKTQVNRVLSEIGEIVSNVDHSTRYIVHSNVERKPRSQENPTAILLEEFGKPEDSNLTKFDILLEEIERLSKEFNDKYKDIDLKTAKKEDVKSFFADLEKIYDYNKRSEMISAFASAFPETSGGIRSTNLYTAGLKNIEVQFVDLNKLIKLIPELGTERVNEIISSAPDFFSKYSHFLAGIQGKEFELPVTKEGIIAPVYSKTNLQINYLKVKDLYDNPEKYGVTKDEIDKINIDKLKTVVKGTEYFNIQKLREYDDIKNRGDAEKYREIGCKIIVKICKESSEKHLEALNKSLGRSSKEAQEEGLTMPEYFAKSDGYNPEHFDIVKNALELKSGDHSYIRANTNATGVDNAFYNALAGDAYPYSSIIINQDGFDFRAHLIKKYQELYPQYSDIISLADTMVAARIAAVPGFMMHDGSYFNPIFSNRPEIKTVTDAVSFAHEFGHHFQFLINLRKSGDKSSSFDSEFSGRRESLEITSRFSEMNFAIDELVNLGKITPEQAAQAKASRYNSAVNLNMAMLDIQGEIVSIYSKNGKVTNDDLLALGNKYIRSYYGDDQTQFPEDFDYFVYRFLRSDSILFNGFEYPMQFTIAAYIDKEFKKIETEEGKRDFLKRYAEIFLMNPNDPIEQKITEFFGAEVTLESILIEGKAESQKDIKQIVENSERDNVKAQFEDKSKKSAPMADTYITTTSPVGGEDDYKARKKAFEKKYNIKLSKAEKNRLSYGNEIGSEFFDNLTSVEDAVFNIAEGADINYIAVNGDSVFHRVNSPEVLQLLLEHPDLKPETLNAVNNSGRTALSGAIQEKKTMLEADPRFTHTSETAEKTTFVKQEPEPTTPKPVKQKPKQQVELPEGSLGKYLLDQITEENLLGTTSSDYYNFKIKVGEEYYKLSIALEDLDRDLRNGEGDLEYDMGNETDVYSKSFAKKRAQEIFIKQIKNSEFYYLPYAIEGNFSQPLIGTKNTKIFVSKFNPVKNNLLERGDYEYEGYFEDAIKNIDWDDFVNKIKLMREHGFDTFDHNAGNILVSEDGKYFTPIDFWPSSDGQSEYTASSLFYVLLDNQYNFKNIDNIYALYNDYVDALKRNNVDILNREDAELIRLKQQLSENYGFGEERAQTLIDKLLSIPVKEPVLDLAKNPLYDPEKPVILAEDKFEGLEPTLKLASNITPTLPIITTPPAPYIAKPSNNSRMHPKDSSEIGGAGPASDYYTAFKNDDSVALDKLIEQKTPIDERSLKYAFEKDNSTINKFFKGFEKGNISILNGNKAFNSDLTSYIHSKDANFSKIYSYLVGIGPEDQIKFDGERLFTIVMNLKSSGNQDYIALADKMIGEYDADIAKNIRNSLTIFGGGNRDSVFVIFNEDNNQIEYSSKRPPNTKAKIIAIIDITKVTPDLREINNSDTKNYLDVLDFKIKTSVGLLKLDYDLVPKILDDITSNTDIVIDGALKFVEDKIFASSKENTENVTHGYEIPSQSGAALAQTLAARINKLPKWYQNFHKTADYTIRTSIESSPVIYWDLFSGFYQVEGSHQNGDIVYSRKTHFSTFDHESIHAFIDYYDAVAKRLHLRTFTDIPEVKEAVKKEMEEVGNHPERRALKLIKDTNVDLETQTLETIAYITQEYFNKIISTGSEHEAYEHVKKLYPNFAPVLKDHLFPIFEKISTPGVAEALKSSRKIRFDNEEGRKLVIEYLKKYNAEIRLFEGKSSVVIDPNKLGFDPKEISADSVIFGKLCSTDLIGIDYDKDSNLYYQRKGAGNELFFKNNLNLSISELATILETNTQTPPAPYIAKPNSNNPMHPRVPEEIGGIGANGTTPEDGIGVWELKGENQLTDDGIGVWKLNENILELKTSQELSKALKTADEERAREQKQLNDLLSNGRSDFTRPVTEGKGVVPLELGSPGEISDVTELVPSENAGNGNGNNKDNRENAGFAPNGLLNSGKTSGTTAPETPLLGSGFQSKPYSGYGQTGANSSMAALSLYNFYEQTMHLSAKLEQGGDRAQHALNAYFTQAGMTGLAVEIARRDLIALNISRNLLGSAMVNSNGVTMMNNADEVFSVIRNRSVITGPKNFSILGKVALPLFAIGTGVVVYEQGKEAALNYDGYAKAGLEVEGWGSFGLAVTSGAATTSAVAKIPSPWTKFGAPIAGVAASLGVVFASKDELSKMGMEINGGQYQKHLDALLNEYTRNTGVNLPGAGASIKKSVYEQAVDDYREALSSAKGNPDKIIKAADAFIKAMETGAVISKDYIPKIVPDDKLGLSTYANEYNPQSIVLTNDGEVFSRNKVKIGDAKTVRDLYKKSGILLSENALSINEMLDELVAQKIFTNDQRNKFLTDYREVSALLYYRKNVYKTLSDKEGEKGSPNTDPNYPTANTVNESLIYKLEALKAEMGKILFSNYWLAEAHKNSGFYNAVTEAKKLKEQATQVKESESAQKAFGEKLNGFIETVKDYKSPSLGNAFSSFNYANEVIESGNTDSYFIGNLMSDFNKQEVLERNEFSAGSEFASLQNNLDQLIEEQEKAKKSGNKFIAADAENNLKILESVKVHLSGMKQVGFGFTENIVNLISEAKLDIAVKDLTERYNNVNFEVPNDERLNQLISDLDKELDKDVLDLKIIGQYKQKITDEQKRIAEISADYHSKMAELLDIFTEATASAEKYGKHIIHQVVADRYNTLLSDVAHCVNVEVEPALMGRANENVDRILANTDAEKAKRVLVVRENYLGKGKATEPKKEEKPLQELYLDPSGNLKKVVKYEYSGTDPEPVITVKTYEERTITDKKGESKTVVIETTNITDKNPDAESIKPETRKLDGYPVISFAPKTAEQQHAIENGRKVKIKDEKYKQTNDFTVPVNDTKGGKDGEVKQVNPAETSIKIDAKYIRKVGAGPRKKDTRVSVEYDLDSKIDQPLASADNTEKVAETNSRRFDQLLKNAKITIPVLSPSDQAEGVDDATTFVTNTLLSNNVRATIFNPNNDQNDLQEVVASIKSMDLNDTTKDNIANYITNAMPVISNAVISRDDSGRPALNIDPKNPRSLLAEAFVNIVLINMDDKDRDKIISDGTVAQTIDRIIKADYDKLTDVISQAKIDQKDNVVDPNPDSPALIEMPNFNDFKAAALQNLKSKINSPETLSDITDNSPSPGKHGQGSQQNKSK